MNNSRKILTFWLVLYVAGTAGIGGWLLRVREHQLYSPATPEMQASWEEWKADVQSEAERRTGPVARRVPTASEPPATTLMRDHFPAIMTTVFLVWTAMFGFLAMAITGVLRGTPPPRQDELPRAETG